MNGIVVDIGGTNLRIGFFEDGVLKDVKRCKVRSFAVSEEKGLALYRAFLSQLSLSLQYYLEKYPQCPIGIAFPGPISPDGVVSSAPTLWGNEVHNVAFLDDCKQLFKRPIIVMNDISAAVWRYAKDVAANFCLFTLSSGVGNKVFCDGNVMLNEEGQGGELGHCQVAFDEYALPCDCGGKGHLGALASGRGIEQLSRHIANKEFTAFSSSKLGLLCQGEIEKIDSHKFVSALHLEDKFSERILEQSQHYLVNAMSNIYHAIGIKRFIFIGGFCCAVGQQYLSSLNKVVKEHSWFGLSVDAMESMCQLGALDDDHSLIGLGHYLMEHSLMEHSCDE